MTYTLLRANTLVDYTTGAMSGVASSITCISSTAGNLLVCGLTTVATASSTVTFPAGWQQAAYLSPASQMSSGVWYYPNCPAGITSIVPTLSSGNIAFGIAQILEYHDSAGSGPAPLDAVGTASGTVTPLSIGTSTGTTVAHELVVSTFTGGWSGAGVKVTLAAGTGFTKLSEGGAGIKQEYHSCIDHMLDTGTSLAFQTDSVTSAASSFGLTGAIATFAPYTAPVGGLLPQQLHQRAPEVAVASSRYQASYR